MAMLAQSYGRLKHHGGIEILRAFADSRTASASVGDGHRDNGHVCGLMDDEHVDACGARARPIRIHAYVGGVHREHAHANVPRVRGCGDGDVAP